MFSISATSARVRKRGSAAIVCGAPFGQWTVRTAGVLGDECGRSGALGSAVIHRPMRAAEPLPDSSGNMSAVSTPLPPTSLPPAPPSPAPRRVATPSWLDLRLVLGVLLVLASVLVGARIVSSARETYARVAVRHDLAVGTVLGADDLELQQVQLPDAGRNVYLSAVRDALGKKLNRPLAAGELVPASALSSVAAQTTVTVPLAA